MFERKAEAAHTLNYILVAGVVVCALLGGCKRNSGAQSADPNSPDPAAANLAPVDPNQAPNQPQSYPAPAQGAYPVQRGIVSQTGSATPRTRVLGQSQANGSYQQSESYGQQPAPIERAPDPRNYTPPRQSSDNGAYREGDETFDQSIDQYAEEAPQPPPPLPVYEQPPVPEPNYLWTPGYWSYAPTGYFWVPGAWCAPPYAGALWTPGYWGYVGNRYRFRRGFWGLHIGYYGGIAYGFGYTGHGYEGGYWRGNDFYYNRAVNRVNETVIRNTYVRNVTINNTVVNNRISYNGPGGVQARPAAYEVAAMRERHAPPMAAQIQIRQQAAGDRQQFFTQNRGRPAVAVAQRTLAADRGVVAPPRQPLAAPGQGQQSGRTGGFGHQAQPGQSAPPNTQANQQQHFQTQPANGAPQRTGGAEQQRFGGQAGQPQRPGEQPRPGQPQQEPQGQRTLNTLQHDQLQNGTVRVPAATVAQPRQFERNQPVAPMQPQQMNRQDQVRRTYQPNERQRGTTNTQPEQRTPPAQTPQQQIQSQPQQPRSQFGQSRDSQQQYQQRQPPQVQPRLPQVQQQPQPQIQQRAPQAQPQLQQRAPQQPRVEPQQQRSQPQPGGQPHAEAPHQAPQGRPHEERSPK